MFTRPPGISVQSSAKTAGITRSIRYIAGKREVMFELSDPDLIFEVLFYFSMTIDVLVSPLYTVTVVDLKMYRITEL